MDKAASTLAETSATYDPTLLPFTSPLRWNRIILSRIVAGVLVPQSAKFHELCTSGPPESKKMNRFSEHSPFRIIE